MSPPIRLAVFGSPVSHSLSPRIHGLFARQCGLQVDYRAIEATAATFAGLVRALAEQGARGCNVTVPFKHAAWELAARSSEDAARARAANTLVCEPGGTWYADNTLSYLRDVQGITDSLGERGTDAHELSAVYCSTLARAVQSAEIIAEPYNLSQVRRADLRERSFGLWEGMTFTEIREKYPDEFAAWAANPLAYSPLGGETTREVRDRVIGAVDTILREHAGRHVAVVAHGGVNRIILCHILGIPLENIFRIEQDYAALNIVEFWEKYPVLKLLNG